MVLKQFLDFSAKVTFSNVFSFPSRTIHLHAPALSTLSAEPQHILCSRQLWELLLAGYRYRLLPSLT